MKFEELRPCDLCKSPVAGNTRDGKSLDFVRLVVERHLLNLPAVQERVGLTVMMGGNEALAGAFASRDDATVLFPSAREVLVCWPCLRDEGLTRLIEGDPGRELPGT